MHVTCPTCKSNFAVPDDMIPGLGLRVRCVRCGAPVDVNPPMGLSDPPPGLFQPNASPSSPPVAVPEAQAFQPDPYPKEEEETTRVVSVPTVAGWGQDAGATDPFVPQVPQPAGWANPNPRVDLAAGRQAFVNMVDPERTSPTLEQPDPASLAVMPHGGMTAPIETACGGGLAGPTERTGTGGRLPSAGITRNPGLAPTANGVGGGHDPAFDVEPPPPASEPRRGSSASLVASSPASPAWGSAPEQGASAPFKGVEDNGQGVRRQVDPQEASGSLSAPPGRSPSSPSIPRPSGGGRGPVELSLLTLVSTGLLLLAVAVGVLAFHVPYANATLGEAALRSVARARGMKVPALRVSGLRVMHVSQPRRVPLLVVAGEVGNLGPSVAPAVALVASLVSRDGKVVGKAEGYAGRSLSELDLMETTLEGWRAAQTGWAAEQSSGLAAGGKWPFAILIQEPAPGLALEIAATVVPRPSIPNPPNPEPTGNDANAATVARPTAEADVSGSSAPTTTEERAEENGKKRKTKGKKRQKPRAEGM